MSWSFSLGELLVQSKYVGTGHADVTKYEWLVNQHRDSSALYVAQPGLVSYFAIAEGETAARTRINLLEVRMERGWKGNVT